MTWPDCTVLDEDLPAREFIWGFILEGKLDLQWISSGPKNRGWRRKAEMQINRWPKVMLGRKVFIRQMWEAPDL